VGDRLQLDEDGVGRSDVRVTGWPRIHVYFTLTGHSNYGRRVVFVDDVQVNGAARD